MLLIGMVNNMADSIIKKVKGLFMSKTKNKKADTGFDVLDDSQAPDSGSQALDADVIGGGLGISMGEMPTEAPAAAETLQAPAASDDISEDSEPEEKTEPKAEVRAEKAHERASRIAAEMNTKEYGL